MVANKPSFKSLLIVILVFVFILVLGGIGIIYHFNKSDTEVANGNESLNQEREISNKSPDIGELPHEGKGTGIGGETPKSKGTGTGGSVKDENLAAKLEA